MDISDFSGEFFNNFLTNRSQGQYELAYANCLNWIRDNKDEINEINLIIYCKELSKRWESSSLWRQLFSRKIVSFLYWSKLTTTLNLKCNRSMDDFKLLKSFLKTDAKGYRPKRSLALSWIEINKFIDLSEDYLYLGLKVNFKNTSWYYKINFTYYKQHYI